MTSAGTRVGVRRLTDTTAVIAIAGDVTVASEAAIMDAYDRVSRDGARVVILDFEHLGYMNSGGIGLLVTLLVRMQRQRQELMAVGLSEHYRAILALTRLDQAIRVHETEAEALAAIGG